MANIVEYEVRGKVAIITLNRPEARNAVNGDVASNLEAAIDQLENDPQVWIGILSANTAGNKERKCKWTGCEYKANSRGGSCCESNRSRNCWSNARTRSRSGTDREGVR